MVLPVSGPIIKEKLVPPSGPNGTGGSTYFRTVGYKQTRPYDLVLGYDSIHGKMSSNGAQPSRSAADLAYDWISFAETWGTPFHHATNKAYDKLKDQISERASLGVTLAEVNQSLGMINKRSIQLYRFGRKLARGDFLGAAAELRMASVPKRAKTSKSFADNYLEYHFGWAPLIGDVHSAYEVLKDPIKSQYIRIAESYASKVLDLNAPSKGSNPYADYPALQSWNEFRRVDIKQSIRMGCEVSIDNPNLWLANQLGLINPLVIGYELIPFSFVANWFFNIEQFLSQGTDFFGLTLAKAWTTYRVKGTYTEFAHRTYRWWDNGYVYGGGLFSDCKGDFTQIRRQTGIVKPVFTLRPAKAWHWRRTASAVSLLVQQLHRHL